MQIKIINNVLKHNNWLPVYKTVGSAAMDLYLPYSEYLVKGEIRTVKLGLALNLNPDGSNKYSAKLLIRSSVGRKYVKLANAEGLIDADYQGELCADLIYHGGNHSLFLSGGERICQLQIIETVQLQYQEVEEFENKTVRGDGAFGSTN